MKLSGQQIAQVRSNLKTSVTASMIAQAAVDEEAKNDLRLYIENTSELYPQKQQIIKNVEKKLENESYDPELAVKLWMYWVDEGAKRYIKEFNDEPGNVPREFPRELRLSLARDISEDEVERIQNGEYKAPESAPAQ